jgi:cellulose 1,4-beta-cellobiosidase
MTRQKLLWAFVSLLAISVLAFIWAPRAPLHVYAASHSVLLAWTPPSDGTAASDSYTVLRGTASGAENTTVAAGLDVGCTSNANCTYTDTTVANGTTYYYVVEAINTNGTSAPSNEAQAVVPGNPPAAPTGLKVTVN